jgi:pimeloyl-ACP methyl ester carboxylesterase
MFVNGLSLPALLWEPVIAALPEIAAICYDRPGIGGASGSPGPDLNAQLAQMRAVLATAAAASGGSDRVVIVAHSHGATAATTLARTDPHLVCGLVLVDPSIPRPHSRAAEATQKAAVAMMTALARRRWGARAVGRATIWLLLRGGMATPDGFWPPRRVRAAMARQEHLLAAVAELRVEPEDLRLAAEVAVTHRLPPIPITILAGELAGWPGYYHARGWVRHLDRYARELGEQATSVELVRLRGAHLLMLDRPCELARIVTEMSQRTP